MTDYDESIVVLTDESLALVESLRTVREDIKVLKAREDELRSLLLSELKDAEFGVTASGVPLIEVQRQARTRVDSKRLQAVYEDVWRDCQIASEVEVLRFPELSAD
jgi:predicted phage-related endonuclease